MLIETALGEMMTYHKIQVNKELVEKFATERELTNRQALEEVKEWVNEQNIDNLITAITGASSIEELKELMIEIIRLQN